MEDPHASQNTKEKERKTTRPIFEHFTGTSSSEVPWPCNAVAVNATLRFLTPAFPYILALRQEG